MCIRDSLEFIRVAELERSLPEHLARLERACAQAHDVIAKRFFNAALAIRWSA